MTARRPAAGREPRCVGGSANSQLPSRSRPLSSTGSAATEAIDVAFYEAHGYLPAVTCCQLEWGDAAPAQLEAALGHVGRAGGQCAQWIVAGDVVYHPQSSLELEVTLRQLILRGGCSLVIISWCERGQQAEQFLWRLSDLGTVRTAFRERDSRFSFMTRRQGRLMQREVEHGISLLSIDGRGAAASTMSQLRQRWRIQWARANCAMAACIRRCRSAEQVRLQDR